MKNKEPEIIILNTSPEAASLQTVTGWVSRDGRFWGNDERVARWVGCTHIVCECGQPAVKNYTCCEQCREKMRCARYEALKFEEWDGITPLFSESLDRYFFDADELHDAMDDIEDADFDPMLLICIPNYARKLDGEYWSDELPEDRDIDDCAGKEVAEAIDALNKLLDGKVLSWSAGKKRTSVKLEKSE